MASRRRDSSEDELDRIARALIALLAFGLIGFVYTHQQQVMTYGAIALVVVVAGVVGYLFWKRSRTSAALSFDDEKILFMLKGMTPPLFEQEIAKMFTALGYDTEVVGGANDGGIDVVARKGGEKFYIQCKKFMTREVTPHDVRDFLGAITNINNPAEQGFFVTTGNFTLMAKKAAEGNPRIELIDGLRLVEYYKMAFGKNAPEVKPSPMPTQQNSRKCPRCGKDLTLKTAHKGGYAGQQFWGCSGFPNCTYIENIYEKVAAH